MRAAQFIVEGANMAQDEANTTTEVSSKPERNWPLIVVMIIITLMIGSLVWALLTGHLGPAPHIASPHAL